MKLKKSMTVLTIIALGSMLLFAGCKPHHSRGAFILDYISEALDLTAEQQSSLEAIKVELEEKIEAMHKDKAEKHSLIKELLISNSIDKETVQQMITEHRSKMDEVIELAVDRLIAFHATLSAEQREKLVTKFEKFEKYHLDKFHD